MDPSDFFSILVEELSGGNPSLTEEELASVRRDHDFLRLAGARDLPSLYMHRYRHSLDLLSRLSDRFRKVRCLEAGCGFGTESLLLASGGAAATGLDIEREALAVARRRKAFFEKRLGRRLSVRFLRADISNQAGGRVHLILARHAVHHFVFPEGFVREALLLLEPGGALLIIDSNVTNPLERLRLVRLSGSLSLRIRGWSMNQASGEMEAHPAGHRFHCAGMEDLLTHAGFRRVRVRGEGAVPVVRLSGGNRFPRLYRWGRKLDRLISGFPFCRWMGRELVAVAWRGDG